MSTNRGNRRLYDHLDRPILTQREKLLIDIQNQAAFVAGDLTRRSMRGWFTSSGDPNLDYGPRRLGTPEDPLRLFGNDNLGTPVNDPDRYYMMSHPEIDFSTLKSAVIDSSTGWIPPHPNAAVDLANGYDTRFLFSFGRPQLFFY